MTETLVSEKEARTKRKKKGQVAKRQGAVSTTKVEGRQKYTRITGENLKWVARTVIETGASAADVVNAAIASVREGKKFAVEHTEPAYIRKMMASRERKIARLKKLADL